MRQAKPLSQFANTASLQPVFAIYYADSLARLADALAGFVDEARRFADTASRQPDNGHRRRDMHDVFTDNSLRQRDLSMQHLALLPLMIKLAM